MRGRVALLIASLSLVVVAAGTTAEGTGLRGVVVTATPVCIEGSPCTRPAPDVVLAFRRDGAVVARARADREGGYQVRLRPGLYRVEVVGARRIERLRPDLVRVVPGRIRLVGFELDRGLQ